MSIDGDLGRYVVGASVLELGHSVGGKLRSGKDLRMIECGFGMEAFSGRRMTSERSDVADDGFEKVGCGGGSGLDSGSCRLLRKSYQLGRVLLL